MVLLPRLPRLPLSHSSWPIQRPSLAAILEALYPRRQRPATNRCMPSTRPPLQHGWPFVQDTTPAANCRRRRVTGRRHRQTRQTRCIGQVLAR